MSIAVGIDLGTTYSAIAWVNQHGVPEIIANAEGDRITPSVLLFEDDEVIVGTYAEQSAVVYPERIVSYIKRFMGDPDFVYLHDDKEYSPEELSAFILKKLKADAETRLNATIEYAVITVPAYFNDYQRRATIRAGEMAGLKILKLINEPTAAAFAYGLKNIGSNQRILVFDLGGGTFDVTLVEVDGPELRVLATDGDHQLGGKDFDDVIVGRVAEAFQEKHNANPLDDILGYHDLLEKCVNAKRSLSRKPKSNIFFDYQSKVMRYPLTKEEFETLSQHLLDRCMQMTQNVLDASALPVSEVDIILLAGGSTRMPMVRDRLREFFGKEPSTDINPDEAIALGAALTGSLELARITGTDAPVDLRTHDVTSHSLGMVTYRNGALHNSVIIEKNTRIPTERTRNDFTTTHDGQTSIDLWLVQGEEEDPMQCAVLGHFEFYNIPARNAGLSKLSFTYRYTEDGTVEVEAMDMVSGRTLPHRMAMDPISLTDMVTNKMPIHIALIIDCSGSMYGSSMEAAKKAAKGFSRTALVQENRQIAVLGFPGGVFAKVTDNLQTIYTAIDTLHPIGSTPLSTALDESSSILPHRPGLQRVFLILTDGHPDDPFRTIELAERIRSQGGRIITVGVGDQVETDFLQSISTTESDFHHCGDSLELEGTFLNLATQLSGDTTVIP
jgi:molecular chaperone DnaK